MNPAIEQCKATIAKHSKSFAWASRALPERLRDDAVVLYAYCRHADDAIDLVAPNEQPTALNRLREELEGVYSERPPSDAVLLAFREVIERRGIPRAYPEELLNGMEMDCRGETYDTLEQLRLYCFRVAGTVGLMMCHVLGVSSPVALKHAAHLGIAMQLTNICRDIDEDAARGRLYLPQQFLKKHGSHALAPMRAHRWTALERQAIAVTTAELLTIADRYYASGDAGLKYLPAEAAYAVSLARTVYSDLGRVLRTHHFDPTLPRAYVTTPRKLYLAVKTLSVLRHQPKHIHPVVLEPPLTFEDIGSL